MDITFDDVVVNGGRPRTCAEAREFPSYGTQCQAKNLYISSNGDNQAPTGGFSDLAPGQQINTSTFTINGWANDDTRHTQ